jgi:aryl-alcohol dehydrogenase-like predicted oxidoreductase
VLGMGCGRVGSINNMVPMREIEATLEAAVEAGVTLFDTADIYGQGDSERTLRTLIARHPGRLFVVTKVGFVHGRLAGVLRFAKPLLRAVLRPQPATRGAVLQARAQAMSRNFSPQYLREAVDQSRRRLGVDRLDALMLHCPPHEVLMSSETHELLSDLVQRQRVSHVGVSATSFEEVKAALSIPAVTMLQISSAVVRALSGTALVDRLRERDIALFTREILRKPVSSQNAEGSPAEALSAALVPPFVTAAVVGVSTRAHLNDFLPAVS